MKTGSRKKVYVNVVFVFFCLCIFIVSCKRGSQDTGINPAESFSIIYDNPDTYGYIAVDIKEVIDGYTILGTVDNSPYLLKVDKQGDVLGDTARDFFINYTNPSNLLILNRQYYFFCNKPSGNQSPIALMKLAEINDIVEEVSLGANLFFENVIVVPLHSSKISDDTILLMALDEDRKWNFVIKMNSKGQGIWRRDFGMNDICYFGYRVLDKRQHFTGVVANAENDFYYIHTYSRNAFFKEYDTCFWVNILNPNSGNPFIPYESSLFPVRKPLISLDWDEVNLSGAFIDNNIITFIVNSEINHLEMGIQQFELMPSKPVFTRRVVVNNEEVVFFVGSSKDNRIVLYCYNRVDETRLNKKYYGHTQIYEASGLILTDDGGLAILGTTYVAGQLGRICLFKLSKADLEDMVSGGN